MSFFIEQQIVAEVVGAPFTAVPGEFEERDDAVAVVSQMQHKFKRRGFEEEQGYWWARNDSGPLFIFIIRAR